MKIDMGRVKLASEYPSGSDSESSREDGKIRSCDGRSVSSLPHAESVFADLRARDLSSVRRQIPTIAREMKEQMEQFDRSLRKCILLHLSVLCHGLSPFRFLR
jgi:hypothetical protein